MYSFEDILNQAKSYLPETAHLVYVEYDDRLMDEQIETLIEGGTLYEDVNYQDWESDARFYGAEYDTEQAMNRLEEAHTDDEFADWLDENRDELEEALREELYCRDVSDPGRDLAANSGSVTLQVPLIDEDHAEWGEDRKASQLLAALGTTDERYYNRARALMAEAPTDLGMAWVAFEVPVLELYDGLDNRGTVSITDPVVIYGNPFTGGVWDTQFKGLTYTTDAAEIAQEGAWGCSLDSIYGGFYFPDHGYFLNPEGENPAPIDPEKLSHMDTLYDYTLNQTI